MVLGILDNRIYANYRAPQVCVKGEGTVPRCTAIGMCKIARSRFTEKVLAYSFANTTNELQAKQCRTPRLSPSKKMGQKLTCIRNESHFALGPVTRMARLSPRLRLQTSHL
jgi:hypothetical protein